MYSIPFERQFKLPGRNHQYDFMLSEFVLIIELDGCHIHGCPCKCSFLSDRIKRKMIRDHINNQRASVAGYRILRIWYHDHHDVNCIVSEVLWEIYRSRMSLLGLEIDGSGI